MIEAKDRRNLFAVAGSASLCHALRRPRLGGARRPGNDEALVRRLPLRFGNETAFSVEQPSSAVGDAIMRQAFANTPHRRFNPLLEEWALVSPHRAKRPWQGGVEKRPPDARRRYDPDCYLCPGNTRSSGRTNPDYADTFVFENDFPALHHGEESPASPVAPTPRREECGPAALGGDCGPAALGVKCGTAALGVKCGTAALGCGASPGDLRSFEDCAGLIRAAQERGVCRVVCFSPRHDQTLPRMETSATVKVIALWAEQYEDLGAKDFISHVLIFENKGEMMGCSNPHPHGQIWATERVPSLAGRKIDSQLRYFKSRGALLLMDYLAWELAEEERLIARNDSFVALVPFWAVWPFEAMILPVRPVAAISDLEPAEREAWAEILRDLTIRYDNLFETSFPYSMGINQRPTDRGEYPGVVLHQAFYPPLLRSAVVRKFQVGYEMSGEPQRDITPEQGAARLRDCGGKHYADK